eukprot:3888763-Rhodomonas_salina.1
MAAHMATSLGLSCCTRKPLNAQALARGLARVGRDAQAHSKPRDWHTSGVYAPQEKGRKKINKKNSTRNAVSCACFRPEVRLLRAKT